MSAITPKTLPPLPIDGRLLIVKLGSIGDVVGILPFVNRLRRGWPEGRIGWLIEPKSYPLIKGHAAVDQFFIYQRGAGFKAWLKALKQIREYSPDLVIDLQRILRSGLFTYFSGCSYRLGFDRARCKEGSGIFTNYKIPADRAKSHMVDQYQEFGDFLGLPSVPTEFAIPRPASAAQEATKLLQPLREKKYLVFNVGAAKPANRWPVANWQKLVCLARNDKENIVITGGETDIAPAQIISNSGQTGLLDLAGKTTLPVLAEVLNSAALVITGDTGPMHIASGLNTPTLALFGPADPARTGPYNHAGLVMASSARCAPCSRRRCRDPFCMKEIAPEDVWARARKILDKADD